MGIGSKRYKKEYIMGIVVALVLTLAVVLLLLRSALNSYQPESVERLAISGPDLHQISPDDSITFLSWNIGFAGMDAGMDFFADGGKARRAASTSQVEMNYQAILKELRALDASVMFLQELPHDSFITRGVDVLGKLKSDTADYRFVFSPTVKIHSLPFVGNLVVGKGVFSKWDMKDAVRTAQPTAPDMPTVTVQHYNILETRLPVAGQQWQWVLFNLHLAAFDDGPLRKQQLQQVMEMMAEEYRAGNRVVAGGDWNLLLADTSFPYTTDEKNKFWVKELPEGVILDGWQWAVDGATATCRTLEQPYQQGVNYTCVIDGFLVSPNVGIEKTETQDLQFSHSDHHPVVMKVRSR